MKNKIIDSTINYILKYNTYDDIKIKELRYGLEGIYLTFSKLIIISIMAIALGIFKEMLIYMVIYNILRTPSFGLHATKSWICLLSSSILFLGIPLISKIIILSLPIKLVICSIGIILMYKNAPADTYKRPIVSKKRRKKLKIISTIFTIIYTLLIIFIKDNYVSNCIMFAIVMQNCMISPIVYKIFKLPYNNYKVYLEKHPELSEI